LKPLKKTSHFPQDSLHQQVTGTTTPTVHYLEQGGF
jgi:hypothetical protein